MALKARKFFRYANEEFIIPAMSDDKVAAVNNDVINILWHVVDPHVRDKTTALHLDCAIGIRGRHRGGRYPPLDSLLNDLLVSTFIKDDKVL
ncbi:unnamed protein product [Leptosia nina]|uniref:Uncharacterized protein n=1 Tax=Leptosia nina TaxID=320188 RepID=A0AAV1JWF5_9NEOP